MSVTFTNSGTTFNPQITLVTGASNTVNWSWSGGSTTGLNPLITLSGATSVTMTVSGSGGIGNVLAINLGYGDGNDTTQGIYLVPTSYNYTPDAGQVVTGISFPTSVLTSMEYFLAENTAITSALDFTGCTALQFIELYQSDVTGVTLDSGMTNFKRLDIEACNVSSLDLSPLWAQIYDLRAARQQGGTLAITAGSGNMTNLYHECVRDNYNGVTGSPGASKLPGAYYRLLWDCGFSGTLNATSNTAMAELSASGNQYTSASLTDQFETSTGAILDLHNNLLTGVTLTGCQGLGYIDLHNNQLGQAAVDSILETAAGWNITSPVTGQLPGYPGQYYLLLHQNTAYSSTYQTYVDTLTGNGWYVLYDQGTTAATSPYKLMDGVNWRPGGTGSPPSYFGQALPSSSDAAPAGGLTVGHEFYVTTTGLKLKKYRFYCADANQATDTNISFALWEVTGLGTGTYVTSSTVSLASLTSGTWNTVNAPGTGIALTANTPYMVVVGFEGYHPISTGQFEYADNYFAGLTGVSANGPLCMYSGPLGANPDPYGNYQGAYGSGGSYDPTTNYPTQNYEDSLYWVDIQVA